MSIFDSKNCYATINAFYALNLAEFHMHMHTHPRCEIMYVVKGSCQVLTPNKEFHLDDHQFIFLDANLPHQLDIHGPSSCSILNIEFTCTDKPSSLTLSSLYAESPSFLNFLKQKKVCCIGTDSESLGYALKDLITRLQAQKQEEHFLINLLFLRVLLELSLCFQKSSSFGSVSYVKKACNYISMHLTEDLYIPQIASYAGINKSYLHTLFSQYMHCTINEYINQCRCKQAAFLLSNSSLSITEITFQVGYNSRQHFSATFEKYYNTSPRAYRQLTQKNLIPSTGHAQLELHDNGSMTEILFP